MGVGMLTLIGLLVVGLPFSLHEGYKEYFGKLGPREAALAEASHGAALIVLPVLVMMHLGGVLPSWSPLAMLALMIWGGFWLFNGAKFSVGWRDPKLIARACIKIGLAVLVFHATARGHSWNRVMRAVLAPLVAARHLNYETAVDAARGSFCAVGQPSAADAARQSALHRSQ